MILSLIKLYFFSVGRQYTFELRTKKAQNDLNVVEHNFVVSQDSRSFFAYLRKKLEKDNQNLMKNLSF